MPFLKEKVWQGRRLGVWRVTETLQELLDMALLQGVSVDLSAKGEKRLVETIATRLLLLRMVGPVGLSKDAAGKPYLVGAMGCVSISHTKGLVALLLSDEEAGVDVERCDRDALRMSRRFMNDDEVALLAGEQPSLVALIVWTVKEALFKIVGDVGGTFKDNITVLPFEVAEEGVLDVILHGVTGRSDSCFCCSYEIEDGYLITVCNKK